jgi:hypothetical protein
VGRTAWDRVAGPREYEGASTGPYRFLEPLEGPVPIAQSFVNDGDELWRDVPMPGQADHLAEYLLPFPAPARNAVGMSDVRRGRDQESRLSSIATWRTEFR